MAGKRTITPEVEAQIVQRYVNGERAGSLATEFGINRKTVTTIVRRNGEVVRHQGAASGAPRFPDAEYMDAVKALRDQGMSQQRIGRELGMSQAVVCRILKRAGYPTVQRMTGENHPAWKGGKAITGQGYMSINLPADDPLACMRSANGYVLEHRLVMARTLGRPLRDDETVHHINNNRLDNRAENLQLRIGKHGAGASFKCADCGSHNLVPVPITEVGEMRATVRPA
jgi:transposase-like protein